MDSQSLSIFAIVLSVCGLAFQQFGVLSKMKERITSLETKIDLFWKAIENNVVTLLKTYPTNITKDVLLDKLTNDELTLEDAQLLRTILLGEMATAAEKKLAYVLIVARLEQKIFDLKNNNKKSLWTRLLSS